ncbi:MAG: 1-deoxy-D-xylulose-5-phosphate reductoisomerase [Betaproteobacteria bacterium]|nr:1-deoxy-D-xylulose-5-phosphate reductoisomerase [Betaproteobacteria bacterium]
MTTPTHTRGIAVLGSTGSIGCSTLDVIARHPRQFRAVGLTARGNVDRLFEQCVAFRPRVAALLEPAAARELRSRLDGAGVDCEVLSGPEGVAEVAAVGDADTVMAAIVGAAGLAPTLAAVRAGKRVLLANKEALVMAGAVFMDAVERCGAELLPIDSEHNAVFQCLPAGFRRGLEHGGVRRILLTASGGPFRTTPLERMASVTPDEACAHPNWVMGRKISVDSATMMNKGLEVIEAHWLFGAAPDRIEVVIHPQSVIHSMVEYDDGSVLAQLGNPDMRTPIAHALAYPERIPAGVERLDLTRIGTLSFEPPDLVRFPCLGLAYQALRRGGGAAIALNAANECAVERFLARQVRFDRIPVVVEEVLDRLPEGRADSLEEVFATDEHARRLAYGILDRLAA